MRIIHIVLMFATVASVSSYAEKSANEIRDKALERINACLARNEVSSRECKNLNKNIDVLVSAYRHGDKSVLPVLFNFTYLTDFYDEALLADPNGFLNAVAQLPNRDQQEVAIGIAGGMFWIHSKERFETIRILLIGIPDPSPIKETAKRCLNALESSNAFYFATYFPPQAFAGPAGKLRIPWFSRDMYALGEKPLWPQNSTDGIIYRLTNIGTRPEALTLTVQQGGTAQINRKVLNGELDVIQADDTVVISSDQLDKFITLMNQARFSEMPTEVSSNGIDGAEWIMESVKDGKYHVVVRWCPDVAAHSYDERAFAIAAHFLYELTGHKRDGC